VFAEAKGALLALALGLVGAVLWHRAPGRADRCAVRAGVSVGFVVVATPFLGAALFDPNAMRPEVWRGAIAALTRREWFVGLGAQPLRMDREFHSRVDTSWGAVQAHNQALELLLIAGVPGLLLMLAFTATIIAVGLRLAGIYADTDLLVAECLREGLLDDLTMPELAGVASLFVHEARREEVEQPEHLPTPRLDRVRVALEDLLVGLRRDEAEVGVTPTRELDAGFVAPIVRWASGATLEDALEGLETTGGDFVRNVRQCLDLLDQLAGVTQGPLRERLRDGVAALRRGIVDS
jgi:hypothetical protein